MLFRSVPLHTSHVLCAKKATGPYAQLTVMVLVELKIVDQLKIIVLWTVAISRLTVLYEVTYSNYYLG